MKSQVFDDDDKLIWEYGCKNNIRQGLACTSYIKNGIQQKIIDSLILALEQANGEMQMGKNDIKLAIPNDRN